MRLEGQAKLGYYPTPQETLALLPTWLNQVAAVPRRYLDPCCGKGEALAHIANGHADSYGIELAEARAEAAQDRLAHVLATAYEHAVLTPETFSLVLLNPPYDGEMMTGGGPRMEETFLCDLPSTEVLVAGGVLIYLIPHARLSERIAHHLARWYEALRCFKLPEAEYAVFKQVVVFGVKRRAHQPVTHEALQTLLAWQTGQQVTGWEITDAAIPRPDGQKTGTVRRPVLAPLPELCAGCGDYLVPESPLKGRGGRPFRFQYRAQTEDDIRREAEGCARRIEAGRDWLDLFPPLEPLVIRPAMTPKKGHIAMQVSGGLLGTNVVRDPAGRPALLKGNVSKYPLVVEAGADSEADLDEADDEALKRMRIEERFRTSLTLLKESGELITLTEPRQIAPVLEQYITQLAEIVQSRNVPQYDMRPEPWEWSAFSHLSLTRRLPGRGLTGLTDFQKHLAIALGRLCRAHGTGFVNAEMASGKSTIGLAIAEYLRLADERAGRRQRAYPGLIVGPGVVTGKENWPKEIVEVTPGAHGVVITTGARPLAKPARIGAYLTSLGLTLDEASFEGRDARWAVSKIRALARQQKVALSEALVWALRESLRRAETQPPARRPGRAKPNLLDGRTGGFAWLGLDVPRDENSEDDLRGRTSLAEFITGYRAGRLPRKSFAILSYETAKLGSGRVSALNQRTVCTYEQDGASSGKRLRAFRRVCTCPQCGQVVSPAYDEDDGQPVSPITPGREEEQFIAQKRRFCEAPAPRQVWDAERSQWVQQTHDAQGQRYVCGAPLFEASALRRIPAAEYARKKARGVFGLALADEIHRSKAKGTGVGFALLALVRAARYTVGLTGTLFGGYSTSIFWLLYRLCGEVRQAFRFNDEMRWAEKYGLLRYTFWTDPEAKPNEDGTFTGTRYRESVDERPGISPAIAGIGLKYCTFSSLKDVGLPLPAYSETIVRLDLTPAMEDQYEEADGSQGESPRGLFRWALETQKETTGKGALSVWLNTALNRPDAMFRAEPVSFNRRLSGRGRFAVRQREVVRSFEAVAAQADWLPKESWLARQVQAEAAEGRKCLVYVRQTGERDIQPRLRECLEAHGYRVGILRPSLAPAQRAVWIKRHAREFEVLLTNARLVEVGLNLIMFNTAIFYELEWSLYTLWQSMRRLYRPGALKPVKICFPVYRGTLEERALDLIGAKMLAAQTFYGDEVGGALVDEHDEGNLLNDLVRSALRGLNVGRAEGVFSLAGAPDEAVAPEPVAANEWSLPFPAFAPPDDVLTNPNGQPDVIAQQLRLF